MVHEFMKMKIGGWDSADESTLVKMD